MMAHRIDWFPDHEMTMASAVPKPMPERTTSFLPIVSSSSLPRGPDPRPKDRPFQLSRCSFSFPSALGQFFTTSW